MSAKLEAPNAQFRCEEEGEYLQTSAASCAWSGPALCPMDVTVLLLPPAVHKNVVACPVRIDAYDELSNDRPSHLNKTVAAKRAQQSSHKFIRRGFMGAELGCHVTLQDLLLTCTL